MKIIYSYWLMLFYKLTWIEKEDKTGFYCKKRVLSWLLVFPFILIFRMLINLYSESVNLIENIFSYNCRWVTCKDDVKPKLTLQQKRLLIHRLNS